MMIQKGFCLSKLEKLIKEWPGGSYKVREITPRVPGDIPLMDIRYKYNSRKVIKFIANGGVESNYLGEPIFISLP